MTYDNIDAYGFRRVNCYCICIYIDSYNKTLTEVNGQDSVFHRLGEIVLLGYITWRGIGNNIIAIYSLYLAAY